MKQTHQNTTSIWMHQDPIIPSMIIDHKDKRYHASFGVDA